MNIKLQPLQIDEGDSFKNDALSRKESAEILTQFIKNLNEPYVIAIDSPWGTGKTTFLKMWRAYLSSKGMHSLYFNAWETDFNGDALIALIGEIELSLGEFKLDSKKKKEASKYLQKAKKVGYSLLKKSLPAAIKLATYGILDASQITEEAISKVGEDFAKEQFDSYEKSKKSFDKFKKDLEKFSQEVSEQWPLILIVDELDRCRPDYAIQVLEKIKHLFSIKGIVFVLGIDKEQIGYSIETLYGKGMNKEGYLSRFIDFEYNLPKPDKKSFIDFTIERHDLKDFFSARQKYPNLRYDEENIKSMLRELFTVFDFSLRDIEHVISQLTIVINVTKENIFLHPILLCFLLVMRKKHPDLYNKIKNCEISADELIKKLELDKKFPMHYEQLLRAYLESSMDYVKRDGNDISLRYNNVLKNERSSPEQKKYAQRMLDIIQDLSWKHDGNIIEFLVKKIEISYRFE